jgi:putative PIN family toxin of toxin-antitoxin system
VRVVLDTNILLSALLSERGPPARIVDAWHAQRFELVSSLDQINEFKRVTRYPKVRLYLSRATVGHLVNGLRQAEMLLTRMTSRAEAPDPGDSYLIAMAIAGGADFLVTGDKLLLSLKRIGGTSIVSPRRFATMLGR